ncbi:MAG TPA: sulfite exporter TauE/SafE family protein [Tepidisphaeraceae bacterium]|nr:sulfite exporter TauE/SafE family protein [Tepidisphaeraceae bacterium]
MVPANLDPTWLIIAAAATLIGVTKSGFGSGLGLLVVPVIAMAMGNLPGYGPEAGLGLMLPLLIIGDIIAVAQNRKEFDRQAIHYLLPGTVVGVVIGAAVLYWFHQKPPQVLAALIKIEVGLECLLLTGLHYWRRWRGARQSLMKEPLRGGLTGAAAAVSSTLAHAAGPIIAMYLIPLRMGRRAFVGTSALYFFILNTAKLPAYLAAGMFDSVQLNLITILTPLVLIGAAIGALMVKRLSDRIFTQVVYGATVITGAWVLMDGFRAL